MAFPWTAARVAFSAVTAAAVAVVTKPTRRRPSCLHILDAAVHTFQSPCASAPPHPPPCTMASMPHALPRTPYHISAPTRSGTFRPVCVRRPLAATSGRASGHAAALPWPQTGGHAHQGTADACRERGCHASVAGDGKRQLAAPDVPELVASQRACAPYTHPHVHPCIHDTALLVTSSLQRHRAPSTVADMDSPVAYAPSAHAQPARMHAGRRRSSSPCSSRASWR